MSHRRASYVLVASLFVVALGHGGCNCGGDTDAATEAAATGPGVGGAGAGGSSGSFTNGNGGEAGEMPCASVEQEATLVNRPVDIIVAIDNSGSMSGEIEEVEVQMTQNFASILNAANPPIDYRVIMVAAHGDYNDQEVCISAPLGNPADANADGHCDTIPGQPTDTANFFHHSVFISSHNALCRFRQMFNTADVHGLHPNGYQDLLRDDSFKFFLVITDDRPSDSQQDGCTMIYDDNNDATDAVTMATQWDADMLALSPLHFGTTAMRNYTFWSIVAEEPYNDTVAKPYGDPAPPDAVLAPITTSVCTPDAVNAGAGYQALSIMTGGYRYPTCPLEYTEIFTLMAEGVISGAQVDCEIEIPAPPEGQTIDMNTLQVDYLTMDAFNETFTQVPGPAECNDHSFWVDGNTIFLCPEACAAVQADDNAKLIVKYECGGPPT